MRRNLFPVYDFLGTDIGNIGQSGKDTLSIQVTETTFDVISGKKLCIYHVSILCK